MAVISGTELLAAVQGGDARSLYFLYGKDVAAVEAYTAKLLKRLGGDSLSVQKIEGSELDLGALADAVGQLSMFADRNLIWIHDPPAETWSAERMTAFLKLLDGISSATTLVCNITGLDVWGGKKTIAPKYKKLVDYFTKNGQVCCFEQKTAAALGKAVADRAARSGCTISRQNGELLAELCRCDTVRLGNELDKLCAFAAGGEITAETIRLLVAKLPDENAFALARAVVSQNGKAAMEALEQLCAQRQEPVALLSVISMAFLDLYRAKAAQAAGKHQDHITADFPYRGREFAVRNALRDCAKTSLPQLRACMNILCETDASLKSTRTDGRTQIEIAITRMLLAVKR